jgi:Ca2+-binding RTX toxin-like protein
VRLKAAADFETKASYAFSVVATQGGSSASQAVTLTVTNVDEGIVSGVDAKTVQVEAGSTKAALGTLSSNAALTFDVVAVNNGGGHVYLGDTELAVGVTGLTQAQINSLTFSSVNDGSIQFLAHDGGNTDELNVILDVTAGVGKTYTGDSGANTIDGADGNDTILGKAGADHLLGGAGKDTIDGGAGADWIDGGAGKDSITGGKGNDTIFGGAGKDHLDGGKGDDELHGGLGKDTLTGGSGADKFVFDTALAANNADVIEDFVHGKDTIVLDSDIFAALGAKVGSKEFRANLSGDAQDKNDKLIYETDTGKLYYDADGNKSGDKVLVATFDPHVSNLSHLDFEIV